MGGLVHSMDQLLHIDFLRLRPIIGRSASLFGRLSVSYETEAQQTDDFQYVSYPSRVGIGTSRPQVLEMCRGSNVKDKLVRAFQLESLILAQNERWRQA